MKIKILTFFLIIVLAAVSIFYDEATKPRTINPPDIAVMAVDMDPTPAPSINTVTLDGKEISVASMKEDVVLLHFWAQWCSVCLAEFPDLLKLVAESKGRIGLLAISIDGKREDAESLIKKLGSKGLKVDDPHIYWAWDGTKDISLKMFNTISVPETVIIDKKRMMVKKAVGSVDWRGDTTRELLYAVSR